MNKLNLFLLSSLLTFSTQARVLEDMEPNFKKPTPVASEKSLKQEVIQQWGEVKKTVGSWLNKLKPKSQEQIETENRIQAEINRQKEEQQQITRRQEELPNVKSENVSGFKDFVKDSADKILLSESLLKSSGGIAADPTLPKTQGGVPFYSFKEILVLPKLNIGEEPRLSADQLLLKDYALGLDKYKEIKPLKKPTPIDQREINRWTSKNIEIITSEKQIERKEFDIRDVVTEEKINKLTVFPVETFDEYKEFKKLTKRELKMLAALILNKKGDKCHLVVGLFDDLSKYKKFSREANYHLGVCSVDMGFHSEAVQRLLPLIKAEDAEYAETSIKILAKNLPREYEVSFYETIKNLKSPTLLKTISNDKVAYHLAKGAYKKEHYSTAISYASQVENKSSLYPSALFIVATSQYLSKNEQQAVSTFKSILPLVEKNSDEDLKTLVNINLARISFQIQKYNDALEYYKNIKKNHPLWVQGLIEQGWAQIMTGDYPGAIGNMYSLHSPYFKSVFMPDSWAVRSIGYLNICQYGDAYSSLTKLEKSYSLWLQKVKQFNSLKKPVKDYYFTVTQYLKGKSDQDISGLPYQVIREMARQKSYLNYQDSINMKVDEMAQYEFIRSMIQKDISDLSWRIKKAKERVVNLSAEINKTKTDKTLLKNLTEWKQQITFESDLIKKLNFQLAAYNQGSKSFKSLNVYANQRINREIISLREKAGSTLVVNLKNIENDISKVLENNEFLRYEVFAGSGENIRYQVTGGNVGRVSANTPPPKSLNWDFEGEYWEDEIGSYRSTLKNNCPNSRSHASTNGGKQ